MPDVFAIHSARAGFQTLALSLHQVVRQLPMDISFDQLAQFSYSNAPVSSWWNAPKAKFISRDGATLIPDISVWVSATLVLSPAAYRALRDALKTSGEFLPIHIGAEQFYLFSCCVVGEQVKGVDLQMHELLQSKLTAFKPSVDNLMVFKSPTKNCSTLFCSKRFKQLIESSPISGITFEQY